MPTNTYFDMRNLAWTKGELGGCPVNGCTATLEKADIQRDKMDYCPVHRIRIHAKSRTFVYYGGPDTTLRNILFERQYFKKYILGNTAKAETHRIGHENSEDALTWNVFSRLARGGFLPKMLSTLSQLDVKGEPELYLWGLKINLDDSSPPSLFPPLISARGVFEKNIAHFLTEPDIMLYVPGQLLVLVEAKFTSGNTVALSSSTHDITGEKPKSSEGIVRRYQDDELLTPTFSEPFYSQLYRNLVFAKYMAKKLGVRWCLVNLVSEGQFYQQKNKVEFQDPTQFIHKLLPEKSHDQFLFYSWERLYADLVANMAGLNDLAEYMYNKSAKGDKALAV
jgi:hypothetical protein